MGISRKSSILLRDVVVEEDAASIVRACLELTEGQKTVVELVCRTEMTYRGAACDADIVKRTGGRRLLRNHAGYYRASRGRALKNDLIQRLNNYIENERAQ